MNLEQSIQQSPEEFIAICKSFNVQSLYAFGSSVRDDFDEESSDIDLLVEISTQDPVRRGEQIMAIWDRFESFFKKKVVKNQKSEIRNQKSEIIFK
jgi:predicted nucleotidyltransferase